MRLPILPMLFTSITATSMTARADVHALKGSDTLSGVMSDAVIGANLDDRLSYQGGGSTLGETALVAMQQGIAPMSRAFKDAALANARAAGIEPVPHVIGLDGLGIFVNADNATPSMTLAMLKQIYTCTWTQWEDVPGSMMSGAIKAYRRNDVSGTTDTFKALVGVTAFGACVSVVAEASDIAQKTADEASAIGYAGMSAQRERNRAVAMARDATSLATLPTADNVRNKDYPLVRDLFVYEATGSFAPSVDEAQLLSKLLDRTFIDPILQDNDFFTLD